MLGGSASGRAPPRPALRTAPPLPAAPAAPRSCRPQAVSRSAGAGWMQRCARRGRPARAGEARESPAGECAPRRLRGRPRAAWAAERPGREAQLTRSAPESESSTRSTPEPTVIFPAAPRPGARPMPSARSPFPAAAPIAPLRSPPPPLKRAQRLQPGCAAATAARLRERGQVRPAAGSLRRVRPPASQPPAPLFRAFGTAGEAARRPRRGPAPPPGPCARWA